MEIYFYQLSKTYAYHHITSKENSGSAILKYVYDNNGLSDNFSSRLKKYR